jgi:hypothetical protein
VAFAGAFYRALSFGKSVKAAFESAKAELALTRMPRTRGLGLFVRNGVNESDCFPNVSDAFNQAVNPPRRGSDNEETQNCASAGSQVSSKRAEIDVPALRLMRVGDQLSRSALATVRRAKLAMLADPDPIRDELQWRSSVVSRAHLTLTIKVFNVALSESKRISRTRSAQKDETASTASRCAKKRLRGS